MTDLRDDVPIWPRFVPAVLAVLERSGELHRREIMQLAMDEARLSEHARTVMLDSGKPQATNRIGWTISHLYKAGWIERTGRARYRITEAGRAWLDANRGVELTFAEANRLFREYWPTHEATSRSDEAVAVALSAELEPKEQIEAGIARLRGDVESDLLERLRAADPSFFEEAVVKLLLAMGYGGAERRGRVTGGSGDGGVDGFIDQDALGLERIYVQAKRYGEGNTVKRDALQAFIGALQGKGASGGVFITTSTFSSGARDYAEHIRPRVILIDGARLVKLMVTYLVGVQVAQTYQVVEVDEDFFE
ncbi:Mrr restriction system protein [Pseudoclavibacter triregionum]|nr:Mrr restriction system protein [Pseudoclavibacter triregionum]